MAAHDYFLLIKDVRVFSKPRLALTPLIFDEDFVLCVFILEASLTFAINQQRQHIKARGLFPAFSLS